MKNPLKRISLYLLIILLLTVIGSCSAPRQYHLQSEKDYQLAFNRIYFQNHAEMEVHVKYGRIDLLTSDYAIEVEKIDNFHEGIGQALHYAKETGRKPGLAIFIMDPSDRNLAKLKYVKNLCKSLGIKVWYINEELEKARK